MLGWLKRALGAGPLPSKVIKTTDPDFGPISFFPSTPGATSGFWQMHDNWDLGGEFSEVSCNSIPGSTVGPSEEARRFFLEKRNRIRAVWGLCATELQNVRGQWPKLLQEGPLSSHFKLTALGLDEPISSPPRWSVGFETLGDFWVYIEFQLEGDRITGHHCDT
jgi:hypothetical protein